MAWHDTLTGTSFQKWLRTVGGPSRIPQGQPLDPLGTSFRNLIPVPGWLATIESGGELPKWGASGDQHYTDSRGARFITGGRGDAALTDLGTAVLARWRSSGVDSNDLLHELARCVVVVEEAMRLGVDRYLGMHRFWRELRAIHDADDLFRAPEVLFLASYFNQEHHGFNPWTALVASRVDVVAETPISWTQLASDAAGGDAELKTAVENIRRRVQDGATRPDGRITFCMAHELHDLAHEDMALVEDALARWEVARA